MQGTQIKRKKKRKTSLFGGYFSQYKKLHR